MPTTLPATTAAPPSLLRSYAGLLVPLMLTNVLQAASGTLDGIFLGQMLGSGAIAAVSVFFPIFFFLLAVIIGLSAGTTVLIGQAWGAGERDKARAVAGTAVAMMLVAGLVVAVAGSALAAPLLRLLNTPADVFEAALGYTRLMMAGMPLVFLFWLATSMSRGVGDAVSPMWTLGLATVLSLALTPAFIKGWAGLPRLGTESAAASTLIAYAVALCWMLVRWHRNGHALAPDRAFARQVRIDPATARLILRISVPSSLQMLTMAVAEIVLIGLVNAHGPNATAAYGAVNQVMSWVQFPAMSLGIAASILASHAIGAGKPERLGPLVRAGLALNIAVTGACVAAACLLAPPLTGLFITDGPTHALATRLLWTVAWSVVVLGFGNVLVSVMRASGTVLGPVALSAAAILGIELPLAYGLNGAIGLQGIWWAYAAGFVAMAALHAAYFGLVWRRRAIVRLI
jgi:putative MATE family efflux protein